MAVETVSKRTCNVRVENGTDSAGNLKLTSVSMGMLAKDRWDADKMLLVVDALKPVLSKTVNHTETTVSSTITAGS